MSYSLLWSPHGESRQVTWFCLHSSWCPDLKRTICTAHMKGTISDTELQNPGQCVAWGAWLDKQSKQTASSARSYGSRTLFFMYSCFTSQQSLLSGTENCNNFAEMCRPRFCEVQENDAVEVQQFQRTSKQLQLGVYESRENIVTQQRRDDISPMQRVVASGFGTVTMSLFSKFNEIINNYTNSRL